MKEVYIVSAVRTPMGSFMGALSGIPAPKLGAIAIKEAVKRAGIEGKDVQEVFMGNVLQAGVGQAPARQAAVFAGLGDHVPSTTVNKVCASGMKAIMFGAQSIMLGINDVVVAGGMENMSATPHYLNSLRKGTKYGNDKIVDGIMFDGLTDVQSGNLMGNCADMCATDYELSREDQDKFAIESYTRAKKAWEQGLFKNEIVPVEVPQRKGDPMVVSEDEEYKNVKMEKIPSLRPAFTKEGTVTAANASTLNDGASALVLMSKEKAEELGVKPLARIIGFGDSAQKGEHFTTSPSKAIPIALKMAGIEKDQVDFWEINQAFSAVSLANIKILGLDPSKVDVNGGGVALGHPLGSSGSRIIVTLLNVLQQKNARYGAAGICNGGGGASAMVIERL